MRLTYWLFSCLLLVAALCAAQNPQPPDSKDSSAQTSPTAQPAPPDAPSSAQSPGATTKPEDQKSSPEINSSGTSNDRLFWTLPNFLTLENAGQVPPLSTKEKFWVVTRGSFDPIQIVWYGFLSSISQAENSEPGYGQGWEAYGKRFGAYAADGTIENFMVGAVFPSIFRQDPRYFQSGQGSFMHRTGYSVSRILITRTDSGHEQFNVSEVFGSALASAVSTYSYHPKRAFRRFDQFGNPQFWPSDRTLTNTASVWGSQVGYDAITFVVKEFWPDIRRKIRKQH